MMMRLNGTEKSTQKDSWLRRLGRSIETYPAILGILAAVWIYILQPALAKDFTTKLETEKLEIKLVKIETESRNSDIRIEQKIDGMTEKIERIYQILIENR